MSAMPLAKESRRIGGRAPLGNFELEAQDGAARAGTFHLAHGSVRTPAFMPVGTQATVKGVTPEELEELGTGIILANAYHLYLRPGHELVRSRGGLHRFMGWDGPILTDSGGYQVFSLAAINKVSDEGVWFQSHIDGSRHFITPELMIDVQHALGADVIMAFDECLPGAADLEATTRAVRRTQRWLERSLGRFDELANAAEEAAKQVLLPVIQGGTDLDLRLESLAGAGSLGDWSGFGIGGLSVGEPKGRTFEILEALEPELPPGGVRYLMGVGKPPDLVAAVRRGVDMFDCVLPTRSGRTAQAFTRRGVLNMRNARHLDDPRPVDADCPCPTCRTYSRAYVHHLFRCEEMLGPILLSAHNLHYYQALMADLREAIGEGRLDDFAAAFEESQAQGDLPPVDSGGAAPSGSGGGGGGGTAT